MDLSPKEINELLDLAAKLKEEKKKGIPHKMHEGKNIALIFEKASTRTRCSFGVAAADLGINYTFLDSEGMKKKKKESVKDTAMVLGGIYEGIEYRGFGQERVEELAKYAGVPVWNGLTDESHPTQVLADFLTIKEHCGELKGKKLVFMGDACFNMANSLMVGCAKMGMHYVACGPKKYWPGKKLLKKCETIAQKTGAILECFEEPEDAVPGADIIYTDVWVSMGEPLTAWSERIAELKKYSVEKETMEMAGPQCKFMHCLPAFHDLNTDIGKEMYELFGVDHMEVSNEVFESEQSIVFDEAENRMHTIKAVMAASL